MASLSSPRAGKTWRPDKPRQNTENRKHWFIFGNGPTTARKRIFDAKMITTPFEVPRKGSKVGSSVKHYIHFQIDIAYCSAVCAALFQSSALNVTLILRSFTAHLSICVVGFRPHPGDQPVHCSCLNDGTTHIGQDIQPKVQGGS